MLTTYKERDRWKKLYKEGRLDECPVENKRLTSEEVEELLR